ncbi:HNH endonuclease signature motif containing protein [Streptomyces sparsogenes]|uniref:HNH endonuclease signature motif containing protein n=1 Tax=Streptomyces sparsogenes TaxID=67365 RepID=UPI0033D753B1
MSGGIRYTRELLEKAAANCTDIDEVIAFCGARPYHQLRRHLFRRFAHFGIDVSHFEQRGTRSGISRPSVYQLREAVENSVSIAGALRELGISDTTRARALFRQWVTEDALDIGHFLGQAHQRGKQGRVKPPEQVLVKHAGARRTRTHLLRRALHEIGVPDQCSECGTGASWGGRPMTLEVDHINGDWSDDRSANLRLLCPNCHAITNTWCRGGSHRKAQRVSD